MPRCSSNCSSHPQGYPAFQSLLWCWRGSRFVCARHSWEGCQMIGWRERICVWVSPLGASFSAIWGGKLSVGRSVNVYGSWVGHRCRVSGGGWCGCTGTKLELFDRDINVSRTWRNPLSSRQRCHCGGQYMFFRGPMDLAVKIEGYIFPYNGLTVF